MALAITITTIIYVMFYATSYKLHMLLWAMGHGGHGSDFGFPTEVPEFVLLCATTPRPKHQDRQDPKIPSKPSNANHSESFQ